MKEYIRWAIRYREGIDYFCRFDDQTGYNIVLFGTRRLARKISANCNHPNINKVVKVKVTIEEVK